MQNVLLIPFSHEFLLLFEKSAQRSYIPDSSPDPAFPPSLLPLCLHSTLYITKQNKIIWLLYFHILL